MQAHAGPRFLWFNFVRPLTPICSPPIMNSETNERDDCGDDIYEVSIYSGDFMSDRQGGDEIDQSEEEIAQVHTRIRALCDSGAPLFTEEAIQDLHKQLKSLVDRGQKCIS